MKKLLMTGLVAGGWSVSVVWITPRFAVLAVFIGGAIYWLTPRVQKWLESWFLSSFSFIAKIQREAVAIQQMGWMNTQLPPVESTSVCHSCFHPLIESAQFCHQCGIAQEEETFFCCARCSSAMPVDAKFCPMCRYPIEEQNHSLAERRRNSQPLRALRLVSLGA